MSNHTGHGAWFADVRRIHDVAEVTPGLPVPFTGPEFAAFYFTGIKEPQDTRDFLDRAVLVFRDAFGPLEFKPRYTQTGSTRRYHLEAQLFPSELTLTLTAKAEHVIGYKPPSLTQSEAREQELAVA